MEAIGRQAAIDLSIAAARKMGCSCNVDTITNPAMYEAGGDLYLVWHIEVLHDSSCSLSPSPGEPGLQVGFDRNGNPFTLEDDG